MYWLVDVTVNCCQHTQFIGYFYIAGSGSERRIESSELAFFGNAELKILWGFAKYYSYVSQINLTYPSLTSGGIPLPNLKGVSSPNLASVGVPFVVLVAVKVCSDALNKRTFIRSFICKGFQVIFNWLTLVAIWCKNAKKENELVPMNIYTHA